MPIIAPHHQPGYPLKALHAPHELVCTWPDDCYVQWGDSGLVVSAERAAYRTAFFEAFLKHPDTLIRGEGATIEEAERAAFAKFERQLACPSHEFERGRYTSGAGHCKHCRQFKSDAFEPLTRCEVCDKPTYYSMGTDAQGVEHWYCEAHAHLRPRDTQPSFADRLLDDDGDEA